VASTVRRSGCRAESLFRVFWFGLRLFCLLKRCFMKKKSPNSAPVLRVDETVSLEEQMARRAHELWQQRGRKHGHDLPDRLRAEREINEWHQQRIRGDT